jgi:hypothetical protein
MNEFALSEDAFFDVGDENGNEGDSNSEADLQDVALEMRPSKVFSDTDLSEHQQCLRRLYGMRRNILNAQSEVVSDTYVPIEKTTMNEDRHVPVQSRSNTFLPSSSTDSDETSEASESNGSDCFDLDLLTEKLSMDSRWYELFFHKNGMKLKEFGAEDRVRNLIVSLLEVNSIVSSPLAISWNVENTNPDEICAITHSEPTPAHIEFCCGSVLEDECKVEHVSTCILSDRAPDMVKAEPCMDMAASCGIPETLFRAQSVRSLANSNSIVKTSGYTVDAQPEIQVSANGDTVVIKPAVTTDAPGLLEAASIRVQDDLTKTGLSRRITSTRSSRSSRLKTPRKSIWGSTLIAPLASCAAPLLRGSRYLISLRDALPFTCWWSR